MLPPRLALFATLLFSLYLLLDLLLLSPWLFRLSPPFEAALQQDYPAWTLYFQVVARLGNEGIQVLLLCLFLAATDRLQMLTFLLNVFLCVGVSQLLKLSYSHPRPFWVDPAVQGLSCETGFGHPSGHSGPPLFVLYGLYVTYLRPQTERRVLRWSMCVALVLFQANVVASRLYLGVHGIDQVVLGTLQGIHWCCFYSSLSRDAIKALLILFNRSAKHPSLRTTYLFALFAAQALLLIVVLTISQYVQDNVQVQQSWADRMSQACNKTCTIETPKIKGLKGAGALFTPFAFGMGVIWRAAMFEREEREYSPAKEPANQLLVLVLALVPSLLLHQGLPSASLLSSLNFNWLLPINLVAVVPWLLYRTGLGEGVDLNDLEEPRQYSFLEEL